MVENGSTQLTVFHCLCPLPASRKGLRLLYVLLFLEKEAEIGGRDLSVFSAETISSEKMSLDISNTL